MEKTKAWVITFLVCAIVTAATSFVVDKLIFPIIPRLIGIFSMAILIWVFGYPYLEKKLTTA